MELTTAIRGFIITKTAENYSPATLKLYEQQLARLARYFGMPAVDALTTSQLRDFLVYLKSEYTYRGKSISNKSLYNNWISIRSFFGWAIEEQLIEENPATRLKAPEYNSPPPNPYTEREVKEIIRACGESQKAFRDRNRAIVLLLVDTGARAAELLHIDMEHMEIERQRILIELGKGQKSRYVYFGVAARRYLWKYLAERGDERGPLIMSARAGRLSGQALDDLLQKLGDRVGIEQCNAHRFRHTFAVNFIRNGGNTMALQAALGHESLDMVRRYVHLTTADVERVHRNASPADNWKL